MNTEQAQLIATQSPFHAGEREVQQLAGVREEAEKRGQRMLTADLNAQQITFFKQRPFLVSARVDEQGQPWAGLITGEPGFISFDEANGQCALHWDRATNLTGGNLRPGSELGLLGIDLASRRRNRLNGTVFATDENGWRLLVDQAYGNCPKYITERDWPTRRFAGNYSLHQQDGLSVAAEALTRRSDTFFIATSSGPPDTDKETRSSAWGADISHRGGDPGFLQAENGQLAFEDFPGNNMFNTLGNIALYEHCGILLLDFERGDIFQLSARGNIEHNSNGRVIRLEVTHTHHWHNETATDS